MFLWLLQTDEFFLTFLCWKSELLFLDLFGLIGWICLENSIIFLVLQIYFCVFGFITWGKRGFLRVWRHFNYCFWNNHRFVVANSLEKDCRLCAIFLIFDLGMLIGEVGCISSSNIDIVFVHPACEYLLQSFVKIDSLDELFLCVCQFSHSVW